MSVGQNLILPFILFYLPAAVSRTRLWLSAFPLFGSSCPPAQPVHVHGKYQGREGRRGRYPRAAEEAGKRHSHPHCADLKRSCGAPYCELAVEVEAASESCVPFVASLSTVRPSNFEAIFTGGGAAQPVRKAMERRKAAFFIFDWSGCSRKNGEAASTSQRLALSIPADIAPGHRDPTYARGRRGGGGPCGPSRRW